MRHAFEVGSGSQNFACDILVYEIMIEVTTPFPLTVLVLPRLSALRARLAELIEFLM